ncbi:MAG: hypothetical protein ACOX9R_15855 [Armatimonadota bacterium]
MDSTTRREIGSVFLVAAAAGLLSPAILMPLAFVVGMALMMLGGGDMIGLLVTVTAAIFGPAVVAAVAALVVLRGIRRAGTPLRVLVVLIVLVAFGAPQFGLAGLRLDEIGPGIDSWWVLVLGCPISGAFVTAVIGLIVRATARRT